MRMRTSMNLPDDLYRAVRVRAAMDGRTVTSVVVDALRMLLEEPRPTPHRFTPGVLPPRSDIDIDDDAAAPPFERNDNAAVLDHLDEIDRHRGAWSFR